MTAEKMPVAKLVEELGESVERHGFESGPEPESPSERWRRLRREAARSKRAGLDQKIPPLYRHCSVDSWDPKRRNAAGQEAGPFPSAALHWDPSTHWLLLVYGADTGVGKTHIGTAIWRENASGQRDVHWWSAGALLERIFLGFERGDAASFTDRMIRCSLLMLDDFASIGADDPKALARFFRIIRQRHELQKPSIFTTNRLRRDLEGWDPTLANRIYGATTCLVGRRGASWREPASIS